MYYAEALHIMDDFKSMCNLFWLMVIKNRDIDIGLRCHFWLILPAVDIVSSIRAKDITAKIMKRIALDSQSCLLVEGEGFHWLTHHLDVGLPLSI